MALRKVTLGFFVVALTSACSQQMAFQGAILKNEKLEEPPQKECSSTQVKVPRPTRVLFIVDQSGSNLNGPYEAPGAATDPAKRFRLKVMGDFYLANQEKSHLSWGLTVFNNTSAVNLVMDSSGQSQPFSTVATDFFSAVDRFKIRADVGQTPYRASLTLAKQILVNDLLTAPASTAYLIAFLTDGYPTDYCPGGISEVSCPGRVLESEIDADVKALRELAQGTVEFSTVYYGKPDSEAAKRLKRMATIGGGQFVDTNATSEVRLNDIMETEKEICVDKT